MMKIFHVISLYQKWRPSITPRSEINLSTNVKTDYIEGMRSDERSAYVVDTDQSDSIIWDEIPDLRIINKKRTYLPSVISDSERYHVPIIGRGMHSKNY